MAESEAVEQEKSTYSPVDKAKTAFKILHLKGSCSKIDVLLNLQGE